MRTRLAVTTVAAVAAALLAACSGGDPGATPSAAPASSRAATPSPRPAAVDLLTGRAPRTTGPVVAIKVDNAPLARPYQRGLERAAVVYQELVEGGATRFIAVYDGAPDVEVGPIRSVRESDLELLAGYGPLALAFSGGNTGVLAAVQAAVSAGRVNDASYDVLPGAYRLAERRRDARNFFTRPSTLARLVPDAAAPRDVGLRFGALSGGTPLTSLRAVYSPQYAVTARWQASAGTWQLVQQGRAITGAAPANVVVQRVHIASSRYVDKNGVATPATTSVGSGEATVLRGGRQIAATWSRPTAGAPTRLRDAAGRDVRLAPGQTWVLLLPTTGSVTTG